jgi:hypothetical protein
MNAQFLIVLIIVAVAAVFAGVSIFRRTRALATKGDCEADCGCSVSKSKKHLPAH